MKEKKLFRPPWKTRIFQAVFLLIIAGVGAVAFFQYRNQIKPYIDGKTKESLTYVNARSLSANDPGILKRAGEGAGNGMTDELGRNLRAVLWFLYLVILAMAALFIWIWGRFRRKMTGNLYRDALTGEWNEQYFQLHYDQMQREEPECRWAVCFDIDRFKIIHLLYGALGGKVVLRAVCAVFHEMLPGEEIYHCHRDVFLAVLRGEGREQIREKLNRFQAGLNREMEAGRLPECAMSFGVCSFSGGGDLEQICANAWYARQEAKEHIAEKCSFYGDTLRQQMERGSLEMQFTQALRREEFLVWYQPKYDMRTGKICGAEALVRWQNRNGDLIPPDRFIPVFESTGQIIELDTEVLRLVCRDIGKAGRRQIPVGNVSVNLSRLHVIRTGIVEQICRIVREAQIPAEKLSFEITESVVENEGREELAKLVRTLQEMGFQVYMDDYGTGSSTLRSLADIQFDVLKLDRSFVKLAGDPRIDVILTSTIHMACDLGMEVVAEGVETRKQAEFLLANGCRVAQGYYFSRPLPREEYFRLMKKGGGGV